MRLGDDVLVWLMSGPAPGFFVANGVFGGEPCVFVRLRGAEEAIPCAPEIVTGIGRVIEACDRGSRFVRQWGTC